MDVLLKLSRAIDAFNTFLGRIMFWFTLLMVLVGAYNVITRYLGQFIGVQLSRNTYLELQTYLYDFVWLLGAAFVLKNDAHVRVDILYSNMSKRRQAWIDIFGTVFFLFPMCVVGIIFSWSYAANSWRALERSSSPGGLPFYPLKTLLIVAFFLLILQGISEIIKRVAFLRGRLGEPEHQEVTSKTEAI